MEEYSNHILRKPFNSQINKEFNYLISIYDPKNKTLSTSMHINNQVLIAIYVYIIFYKSMFSKIYHSLEIKPSNDFRGKLCEVDKRYALHILHNKNPEVKKRTSKKLHTTMIQYNTK